MIQLKQLKRLKYESFEYGKYEKLKNLFLDLDFDPDDLEELDLSNERSTQIPNIHCLELLVNLQVLILANNYISKFPGMQIARLLPKLKVFDISDNNVQDLDDLIDMGSLDDLKILDIQGNYVTSYITKINIIEMLLCPKKYLKYNPIKILTAGYNQVPVARLSGPAFDQQKQDRRLIERFPEELRPDELINTVSKYNHKNTLGKYSLEACPIPRKTRFRNLEYLNGQAITKLDIIRVTGVKHFKQVLEDNRSVTINGRPQTSQNLQTIKQIKNQPKKNQKINNQYLRKYIKRINRLMEETDDYVPVKQNDEELDADKLLIQLTQREMNSKKKVLIDPKKFSKELWQIPLDIQYKDSEYSIGIEEFKRQQKDYEKEKSQKLELKEQKSKDKSRKRLQEKMRKKGMRPVQQDSNEQDVDSDPEMKRLFRFRSKPMKPRMNLSHDDDLSYRSSESSLVENHSSDQFTSFSNPSDGEENQQGQVEDKQKKKKVLFGGQKIEGQVIERPHQVNHYQKLKKNVSDFKLQRYVKLMDIPQEEIIQEHQQQIKVPKEINNEIKDIKSQSRLIINVQNKQGIQNSKSSSILKKPSSKIGKELDFSKQIDQVLQEKIDIIDREQEINAKRNQNIKNEMLSDNGYMAQHHPNIVEFMKEKEKQKLLILKPQLTFEEMMDHNVRKFQEVKSKEILQANMKQYIEVTSKKLDEFWLWESQERELRNDKTYCFKRYVKMVREGQIKII